MDEQREDFSKHGKHFQETLAILLLKNRHFCDRMSEVLKEDFFELKYLRVFTNILMKYRTQYRVHPSVDTMTMLLRTSEHLEHETEVIQGQIRTFFAKYMSQEVEDSDFVMQTALDFCRKQTLKEAMLKSVDLLRASSFDEVSKVLSDAMKAGGETNFGYDYFLDFEKRFELVERNPISTGWKVIDDITRGGAGKGELWVVIAPSGAGKSHILSHIGANAVVQGKTVIHYTLELQDTAVASRYDACITEIPLDSLVHEKEMVRGIVTNLTGRLIVKEYPTKHATTVTIRNHIERLRLRNIIPDMIVVDYADLLKPVKTGQELRHDLQTIYEELRGLATLFGIPIVTASQTNRSGLNAEIITMEAISEAFNKCFVADFIFTMSRTIEDRKTNTGRIFVAKNRQGIDGIVYPAFIDTSRVKIRIYENESERNGQNSIEHDLKTQEAKMKGFYKSWKKDNSLNSSDNSRTKNE